MPLAQQLDMLAAQPPSAEDQETAAATSTEPGSVAPEHLVAATGPLHDLAPASGSAASARARVAAVARRLKLSPKPAVGPRAEPQLMPEVVPYAPPPAQTRLPIGGATAGSSGGLGSPGPDVVAAFEVLALAFATFVLARFSLDLAPWRSTLLASPLEHPD